MSSFFEYINLIGKGLKNFNKVAEGIVNKTTFKALPEEDQKLILDRLAICHECPYNSDLAQASEEYLKIMGKPYETKRKDLHCSLCGCVVEFKVASLSSNCGIEVYNQGKKDKLELKWKRKS